MGSGSDPYVRNRCVAVPFVASWCDLFRHVGEAPPKEHIVSKNLVCQHTQQHSRSARLLVVGLLTMAMGSACAMPTTAKRWNDRVGPEGDPVYFKSVSKIGFNLLIFVPFVGDMGIAGMVNDLTEDIEKEGGNRVRIVQGSTENYWYGWSPFTWLLSPVVSRVSAEYQPSAEALTGDSEERARGARWYMPWSW